MGVLERRERLVTKSIYLLSISISIGWVCLVGTQRSRIAGDVLYGNPEAGVPLLQRLGSTGKQECLPHLSHGRGTNLSRP